MDHAQPSNSKPMTRAGGANPFAPRSYGELQKITDRVYIYRNITNSSFVIGDRGVAVIDTQVNHPTAVQVLKAVRSVTDKPITHVINTHYHWDHTNGNQLFKNEGAVIISSKLTREFMQVRAARQKEFLSGRGFELGNDPLLPEEVFEGERTVDLGGVSLRLFFAGRAESDDATAVHVAQDEVLMAGDTIMTGSFPIFGQPCWDEGLQDRQWIDTIGALMALKPLHIVPGHGPMAGRAEVDLLLRIEEYFLAEVGRSVSAGMDLGATIRSVEAGLPDWIKKIPLVWGTPRYAILRVWRGLTRKAGDPQPGWQQFKPSAIPEAKDVQIAQKMKGNETGEDLLAMASEASEGGDAALRIAVLKKGAEKFPSSPEILAALADALIETSRREDSVLEKGDFFSAARKAWDRALEINPVHAGSLLGKGRYLTMMAYRGGEDPKSGMDLLEKVSALKPSAALAAEAEFYLGIGYRRLGDEEKARRQFSRSLELNSAFMPAVLASQA